VNYAETLLSKDSSKFKQPNGCVMIMGGNIEKLNIMVIFLMNIFH